MSGGESAHHEDWVQRRTRRRLAGVFFGADDSEFLALNDGPGNRGIEERRDQQNARAHGFSRADLVETRTGFVDFVIDLSGKGLARCRAISSVRFQSLPIGTVRAVFPHTARPVGFI